MTDRAKRDAQAKRVAAANKNAKPVDGPPVDERPPPPPDTGGVVPSQQGPGPQALEYMIDNLGEQIKHLSIANSMLMVQLGEARTRIEELESLDKED